MDTSGPGEHPATGTYRPALDGLRALAVAAAIGFHVAPGVVPGGFLGVSLFFTLSGYLITSLLVAERAATGRISLGAFWARRARRLWPLSWLTLATIAVAAGAGAYGTIGRGFATEMSAALAQVYNWVQGRHGGYVDAFGRQSPLHHVWSLSIEEQFYVVWPALLMVLYRYRWMVVAGATAASLAITMWLRADADRVYLGTDTRAVELLAGAALALWWSRHPLRVPPGWRDRWWMAAIGVVALGVGAWLWLAVPISARAWSVGGLAAVSALSACLIAAALAGGWFGAALGWRPLVWVGQRSYALYLVHWPIWVALPVRWAAGPRLAITVAASVVLSAMVHRLVENPVRRRRARPAAITAGALVALAGVFGGTAMAIDRGHSATEIVAADLVPVADPTAPSRPVSVTAPGSVPGPVPGSTPGWTPAAGTAEAAPCRTVVSVPGGSPASVPNTGYDGVLDTLVDPDAAGDVPAPCVRRVLVLGDSTARGIANGLHRLHDPRLEIWDRSVPACGLGPQRTDRTCADWREVWAAAVDRVRPDVVLVDMIPVVALDGRDVSADQYESADEARTRRQVIDEAVGVASASGAEVVWLRPAYVHMPEAMFYCAGSETRSLCDRRWTDLWNVAADEVIANRRAAGANIRMIDIQAFVDQRGDRVDDRPDGIHFASEGLAVFVDWLVPQLVGAGLSPQPGG